MVCAERGGKCGQAKDADEPKRVCPNVCAGADRTTEGVDMNPRIYSSRGLCDLVGGGGICTDILPVFSCTFGFSFILSISVEFHFFFYILLCFETLSCY